MGFPLRVTDVLPPPSAGSVGSPGAAEGPPHGDPRFGNDSDPAMGFPGPGPVFPESFGPPAGAFSEPPPGQDQEFFVTPGGLWIPGDCFDPTEVDPTYWSFHRASREAFAVFSRFGGLAGPSWLGRSTHRHRALAPVLGAILAGITLMAYAAFREPLAGFEPSGLEVGAVHRVDPVESLARRDQMLVDDAFRALSSRSENWHVELMELDQLIPRWGMSPRRIHIASGDLFGAGTRTVVLEGKTPRAQRLRVPEEDRVRHLRVRRIRSTLVSGVGDAAGSPPSERHWVVEMESNRPDQDFNLEVRDDSR